jgi:hypothetical protein
MNEEEITLEKEKTLDEGKALLEMYKAGFLDGYKIHNKLKKKADWELMNKFYKLAFVKRFEKRINKILKGKE